MAAAQHDIEAIGQRPFRLRRVEIERRDHAVTRRLGAFKTSMLQDVEAGRAVELDAMLGAVRELGQRCGVATPDTDALLGLARLHARTRGLYPG